MVRVVRRFLYLVTAIFIVLSVFGPINERYQFISLVGAIICVLLLMILVSFEKTDSY